MSHKVLTCLRAFSVSSRSLQNKTHTHTNIHTLNLSPTDTEIFINSLINLNTNTLIGPVKEGGEGGGGLDEKI